MSLKIPYEDLRLYAYSNDHLIHGPIRGIIVCFTGLNGFAMRDEDSDEAKQWAQDGFVYVFPYINPWAWMNRAAVRLTDAVLDALFTHYALPETTPIVSTGGSMGGLCALVYCRYAKRTPVSCAANCPVCDLPFHYTERPDLPRTMLSAFGEYEMPLQDALKTASPLHLAVELPNISYYIVHCCADEAVNKSLHSDRFVAELRKTRRVTYRTVPERGHCDLTDEARTDYNSFIRASALREGSVTIRETRPSDLEDVRALWADGDVMRFVGFPDGLIRSAEEMDAWYARLETRRPGTNHFGVYEDSAYCGETYYSVDPETGSAVLDIKLFPHARGRGIASKALAFAMEQAFAHGAARCWVDPNAKNAKALALYRRLGMIEKPAPAALEVPEGFLYFEKERP